VDYDFRLDGTPDAAATVLALHKTGDSADATLALARAVFPSALIVTPLGDRAVGDRRRFFARHEDGSFDVADWRRAGRKLAAFVEARWSAQGWPRPVLFGHSHGANAALAALAWAGPALACAAVLMRPAALPEGTLLPDLAALPMLVLSGDADPTVPPARTEMLVAQLRGAGAQVRHIVVAAAHGLAAQDLPLARNWVEEQAW
jgi:phospholipase/carboxylesterase